MRTRLSFLLPQESLGTRLAIVHAASYKTITTLWWHCDDQISGYALACAKHDHMSVFYIMHIKEHERSIARSYIAISSTSEPSALVEKGK